MSNKLTHSWITHDKILLLLETLKQLRGVFSHACSTYPFHSRAVEDIDLWCRTPVWAQAEPAVSGCESIFNCCPPQVQSRLPDIVDMCRSWTFNTWYLYLQFSDGLLYKLTRLRTWTCGCDKVLIQECFWLLPVREIMRIKHTLEW